MENKLVYLACPYSHDDCAVRECRFDAANRCAAHLMRAGVLVFSPISHTHPIAQHGLPLGWDFWERYERTILNHCHAVIVLAIDGFDLSKGVREECKIARELLIPIGFIFDPDDARYIEHFARSAGLC